jgi:D-alanine-D-alanine ligase
LLIWAFIPYSIRDGRLDGYDFDTAQSKCELAQAFQALNLAWIWQPVVDANVDEIILQVTESRKREEIIVLNLCDGIEGTGTPGPGVLRALEQAGIPFTGANSEFYEISTSKLRMKEMLVTAGVPTPPFEALPRSGPLKGVCARIGAPVLVKPDVSAASAGVHQRSRVGRDEDVEARRDELLKAIVPWYCDPRMIFAEQFIQGPEFTVFVMGDWRNPSSVRCLPAAERVFNTSVPEEEKFLSYDRHWGFYCEESAPPDGLPFYGYGGCDPSIARGIEEMAGAAYVAVRGCGYARVDLRMDRATGELFVLEVNANCGLSEDDQTSIGSILKLAGMTLADLLRAILNSAQIGHVARGAAM